MATMKPDGDAANQNRSRPDAIGMLSASGRGVERLRVASTKPEGRWLLALGIMVASAVAVMLLLEGLWWESAMGIASVVTVSVLGVFVNWRRAVNRTVRPKHFSVAWGLSAVWAGAGIGVATGYFNESDGTVPSLAASMLAGLIVAAPVFACGSWLLVRGR